MGKYADIKGTTNPSFRVGGTVSAGDVLTADADGVGAWSHTSYADLLRFGFMGTPETSISFDGTDTFTLTAISGTWSYYRSGLKYTITGNKTKVLATPMVDNTLYFIYIDAVDGTLSSSTSFWTLNDTKVPVAAVYWMSALTPKFIMADERHTCLVDRRWHREHHLTEGTQITSGGTISAMTLNSTTPASKVFGVVETQIADEDLFFTLSALTKPDGATAVYYNFYRTSVTVGAVPAKWNWIASDMPFQYTTAAGPIYGYAQYDLNGTSTAGSNNNYINTYLVITNSVNNTETFPNATADTRYMIVQGRVNASSTTAAYAESFGSLDMSGLPVSEAVAVYQFTWRLSEATSVKGRCVLNRVQRITVNIVQTTVAASMDHNTLGGLQGGAIGEYFHLTDEQTSALHAAVTVSAPISLTGQALSLVNNAGTPGTVAAIDIGVVDAESDLKIPTSKAVATAIAAGGGGTGGHIIEDEGTPLTARPALNFVGPGVTVTDSASPASTIVTILGGAGGSGLFDLDLNGNVEPITDLGASELFSVDENGDLTPDPVATTNRYLSFYLAAGTRDEVYLLSDDTVPFFLSNGAASNIPV